MILFSAVCCPFVHLFTYNAITISAHTHTHTRKKQPNERELIAVIITIIIKLNMKYRVFVCLLFFVCCLNHFDYIFHSTVLSTTSIEISTDKATTFISFHLISFNLLCVFCVYTCFFCWCLFVFVFFLVFALAYLL